VIARLYAGDTFSDFYDDARTLVTQNDREDALRIITRQRECVGVADTGVADFDKHFALTGRLHVDLNDFEWLASFKCYGGSRFHFLDLPQ
jgi:protein involved in ribonucleotide reduction